MEAVWGRKERRMVRGAKGGKGRNGSCPCISCSKLKLSAGTTCAHVSGERRGKGGKEGVSWREGRALERAVLLGPPPCPLVASCSTSGDLYINWHRAVSMFRQDIFIFWDLASHVLSVCSVVVGIIIRLTKCGVGKYLLTGSLQSMHAF